MQYIIILIFFIIYFCFGLELGYTNGSPLFTHFTFMFQHVNLFHLIINSLAFIGVYRTLRKFIKGYIIILLCILISFISSFFSVYDIPTVGASAMVYSMIGMYFGITLFDKKIKIIDYKKYSLYVISVLVMLAASYLKESSNFFIHCCSLVISMGVVMSYLIIKQSK